ncbi:MAG TPA: TMEM175 family protein [Rhizomicrobium sp.]|nr:TMEM175 family protein [Rhizomicrobium sp.]
MDRDRLTAFTDGVIAVIITIMVLELKAPHGTDIHALLELWPVFLSYVLSFIYVGIYWNNHHHFFQLVPEVNGGILWANLYLLFWLSLLPFATSWVGENGSAAGPAAAYGAVLFMCAIAFLLMERVIIHAQGAGSQLKSAVGKDLKAKLSPVLYLSGVIAAFYLPVISYALYALVALIWLVPDRRVENALASRR